MKSKSAETKLKRAVTASEKSFLPIDEFPFWIYFNPNTGYINCLLIHSHFLFTFLCCWTILIVQSHPNTRGNYLKLKCLQLIFSFLFQKRHSRKMPLRSAKKKSTAMVLSPAKAWVGVAESKFDLKVLCKGKYLSHCWWLRSKPIIRG